MSDFYDRDGNPISVERWSELFQDAEYKRVDFTERGDVRVSTVWLGHDHSFGYGAPPLIFETMVFDDPENWHESMCERYATEQEARAGHAEICSVVFTSDGAQR